MAGVVLDTGALIALDRGDRRVATAWEEAVLEGMESVTSSACVAEAWRDPPSEARLVRVMRGVRERPLGPAEARRCGLLLALSGTSQITDAAITLCAEDGDLVLTSDPADIQHLLERAGVAARVRAV